MSDFPTPPIHSGKDPFEHVKVSSATEKESKEERGYPNIEVSKRLFFYLYFLTTIKNLLNLFKKKSATPFKGSEIFHDLILIKTSLEQLAKQDFSQNPTYLNYFAFNWLKFLKDFEFLILDNAQVTDKIKKFIEEMHHFPQKEDYSLGYYLSEFAGYKWIPFPYMELLKNLHLEYQTKNESSQLKSWIDFLDALLKTND
ncbi:MAG: hypothetical protein HZB76_00170 [Chlamydiae bacterium]|nr:hypothetical protein [Chlamydiota bacterium]